MFSASALAAYVLDNWPYPNTSKLITIIEINIEPAIINAFDAFSIITFPLSIFWF